MQTSLRSSPSARAFRIPLYSRSFLQSLSLSLFVCSTLLYPRLLVPEYLRLNTSLGGSFISFLVLVPRCVGQRVYICIRSLFFLEVSAIRFQQRVIALGTAALVCLRLPDDCFGSTEERLYLYFRDIMRDARASRRI